MPIAKTNDHNEEESRKSRLSERAGARSAKWHAYAIITVIVCNKEQIAEKKIPKERMNKKKTTHITIAIVLNEGILATHTKKGY